MTTVSYQDRDGFVKMMEAVYKVEDCKNNVYGSLVEPIKVVETNKLFNQIVRHHEVSMIEQIEDRGGKVLNVTSEEISKRRYKRKFAKMIKRNEKLSIITSSLIVGDIDIH